MINTDIRLTKYQDPFPYYLGDSLVSDGNLRMLNAQLPDRSLFKREIKEGAQHRKQYNMWRLGLVQDGVRSPVLSELPPAWSKLFGDLLSEDFATWLSKQAEADLSGLALTMGLYAFGDRDYTTVDTGKLEKAVSMGLYLSEDWSAELGGELNLWTAKEAAEPAISVVPLGGRCSVFMPSPVSWHNIGKVHTGDTRERVTVMIEYYRS